MKIQLPDNVQNIIKELNDHGYAAYAVGGCVRDVLIGRIPGDWDITTSAKPAEIKQIFKRTVDTGIEHGTVTVLIKDGAYEVTTFRVDGEYKDARHPESVVFVPDLKEDLLRRDFTINAMAYNDSEGLIDLYGGIDDLKKGLIKCVGVPCERFKEDALRMLRAVRFSAQLRFEIEEDTLKAMSKLHENLSFVSEERIQTELVKLIMSDAPERWEQARSTFLADMIVPELKLNDELWDQTYAITRALKKERTLRLSAFLHELGSEEAGRVLKRLKFDNAAIHDVTAILALKEEELPSNETELRFLLNRAGDDIFVKSLEFKKAYYSVKNRQEAFLLIESNRKMFAQIRKRGDCTQIKDLAVNGEDLKTAGFKTGPGIGTALKQILEEVLKDPSKNDREYIIEKIIPGLVGLNMEGC